MIIRDRPLHDTLLGTRPPYLPRRINTQNVTQRHNRYNQHNRDDGSSINEGSQQEKRPAARGDPCRECSPGTSPS